MRKLFILLLLGLLAFYVWPTRYRSYDAGTGPYAERTDYPTRVDRFSNEVWYERRSGEWIPLEPEASFEPHRPNPVTEPYTRVDQQEVHRQRNQAQATQDMVDRTVDKAQSEQKPSQ
jgi:hypothetical protein